MTLRQKLSLIGSTEFVEIAGIEDIPAKIDTGADSSAVWASDIEMRKDGVLTFSLFDQRSPFYTGEKIEARDYTAKIVRSSNGIEQIRYKVKLPITLCDKRINANFTLASRSLNNFPVLIGRRTLKGKFLVDPSKSSIRRQHNPATPKINQELKEDPYKFHQKYIKKGEKA